MPRLHPSASSRFRIQGKSIFLTFPLCPLIITFVIDYIWNWFTHYDPSYIRVCQETNEDGEPHLHCLLQCNKQFNIQSTSFCDIPNPNGTTHYHPNMEKSKDDQDVSAYIAKGGIFEERGQIQQRRSSKRSRDEIWTSILNESSSSSDFLSRVAAEQPFVYATQLRNLE
ncbi:hypothetical protein ACFX2I_004027 [Malus domestica]|uniref:CRESS-DNA virus Rep endonuclease domain-containing protein n=1 Tax=Malus domestica TaxID=3750 RepID=A0A498IVL2_MALDO|nr:hypothetical protein DVH24_028740 [Malus domestica]